MTIRSRARSFKIGKFPPQLFLPSKVEQSARLGVQIFSVVVGFLLYAPRIPLRPAMRLSCILFLLALASPLPAEDPAASSGKEGSKDAKGLLGKLLNKIDQDGDGKISDSEKEALHAKVKKEVLDRYDSDHDGKLSDEEKVRMKADVRKKADKDGKGTNELETKARAEFNKRFDKDGDGKLNEDEKKTALAAMKKLKDKTDPKSSAPEAAPPPK